MAMTSEGDYHGMPHTARKPRDGKGFVFLAVAGLAVGLLCGGLLLVLASQAGHAEGGAESLRRAVELKAESSAYPLDEADSVKACARLVRFAGPCIISERALRQDGAAAWRDAGQDKRKDCIRKVWDDAEPAARLYACLLS